ncbi:MAG TPA: tetratricopeptide repeat protein, partial [Elusimicrobiales bacterium]|nr:tetratricopeptide repeat protein [Elusimicrobiales bacterium]
FRSGDTVGAIADFNKAVELRPEVSAYRYWRGVAVYRTGYREGALEDAVKAYTLDNGNARARVLAGDIRAAAGDVPGAIAEYEAAAEADPARTEFYSGRARALAGRGRNK